MGIGDKKKGFIWNTFGGGFVAFQPAVLMFFAAKYYSQDLSGIISVSYAIGVLIYSLARYGMRNFQVTDVTYRYSFATYLKSRFVSIAVALVSISIYLIIHLIRGSYSGVKSLIILEVVILRLISAIEDVFTGNLQQRGMFDLGARITAIREGVVFAFIVTLMWLRININIVFFVAIVISCIMAVVLLKQSNINWDIEVCCGVNKSSVRDLLKECFPLAIGTTYSIFVGNIPKYETDWYLNDYSQAILGYLILPVFTAIMFNQFVYTPFIKELADLFHCDLKEYKKSVKRQILLIILITCVMTVVAVHPGLWLLSLVYGVELKDYSMLMVLLMIGGGLYTIQYYLAIPLTIINMQKVLLHGYIGATFFIVLLQSNYIEKWGLMGVAFIYCLTNLIIMLFLLFAMFVWEHKRKSNETV